MTRFTHLRTAQVGGTALDVKIRDSGHRTQITQKLVGHIETARRLLQVTMAQLNAAKLGTGTKRFAHRYFLTPADAISQEDLTTIKNILELTWNGLNSDLTIKVGHNVGRNDKDVHGVVGQSQRAPTQPYHTQVVDLDDGLTYTTRAMRIDQSTLLSGGRLGVVTLIHEATHKYAGTNDYCYFKDDSVTPDGTFDDKTEALKNADSYAWFTYKMGNTYKV